MTEMVRSIKAYSEGPSEGANFFLERPIFGENRLGMTQTQVVQ